MLCVRALLLAAALALTACTTAHAQVEVWIADGGSGPGLLARMLQADTDDDVRVTLAGGQLTVTGSAGAVTDDRRCATAGATTVVCSARGIVDVFMDTEGGDDRVVVTGGIPCLIDGGDGDDVLSCPDAKAALWGRAGNDRLSGSRFGDTFWGNEGEDEIDGGGGDDTLLGGNGRDTLRGGAGKDLLAGAAGNDTIFGGAGDDWMLGYTGNDRLSGEAGNDRLDGGPGRDVYDAGTGADRIDSRAGRRVKVHCGAGGDSVKARRGDFVARDCERVRRT